MWLVTLAIKIGIKIFKNVILIINNNNLYMKIKHIIYIKNIFVTLLNLVYYIKR
jgi:hypothetical protein